MKHLKLRFDEDIYGKYGIVYHRTGKGDYNLSYSDIVKTLPKSFTPEDFMKSIYISNFIKSFSEEGFKPGSGAMYGKGLYTTYSLDVQAAPGTVMEQYGPLILCFGVKTHRTLILEKDLAQKVYGEELDILQQLEHFGVNKEILYVNKDIVDLNKKYKEQNFLGGRSSAVADPLSNSVFFQDLVKKNVVQGLLFAGNHDGKVLVIYNPDIAKLIKYSYFSKQYNYGPEPTWIKVEETDYLKKVQQNIINLQVQVDFQHHYKEYLKKYGEKQVKLASIIYGSDYKTLERMLVKKEISPNTIFFDKFLIFHLIELDNEKIIKKYIDLGGGTEFTIENNINPLFYAIGQNKKNALKGLFDFKFLNLMTKRKIGALNVTPLEYALHKGHPQIVSVIENELRRKGKIK